MKINIPKAWFEKSARLEGDSAVGAGAPALVFQSEAKLGEDAGEVASELRLAFGRFVQLMRRNQRLTIEQLASKADVDAGELIVIEEDVRHLPEPMTVYQLAKVFGTSEKSLLQLAGLIVKKDPQFVQEAVRFAAKSEPIAKLTVEEQAALETFVAVLNSRK